jgi:hypothetical protein
MYGIYAMAASGRMQYDYKQSYGSATNRPVPSLNPLS